MCIVIGSISGGAGWWDEVPIQVLIAQVGPHALGQIMVGGGGGGWWCMCMLCSGSLVLSMDGIAISAVFYGIGHSDDLLPLW